MAYENAPYKLPNKDIANKKDQIKKADKTFLKETLLIKNYQIFCLQYKVPIEKLHCA